MERSGTDRETLWEVWGTIGEVRGTLGKVQHRLADPLGGPGYPRGGLGRVEKPSGKSRTGRGTIEEV